MGRILKSFFVSLSGLSMDRGELVRVYDSKALGRGKYYEEGSLRD